MRTGFIIACFILFALPFAAGGAAAQQTEAPGNGTATPTPTQTTDSRNASDILNITNADPYAADQETVANVKEWITNPENRERLNNVERERVAGWLKDAETGRPPANNGTSVANWGDSTHVREYEFDESNETLTIWIESDYSRQYSLIDSGLGASVGKGWTNIPQANEKSGTISRGYNRLQLSVTEVDGRYLAKLYIDGRGKFVSSDDPQNGSPFIAGPYESFETRLIAVLSSLVGVVMVALLVLKRRRDERNNVEQL
jgi:hypothetical protein